MGVEFRWQFESEEEWETPESSPKRQWWVAGAIPLLLVVGAGIAAGVLWQRARQGEERLKRELKTVANLEAQALRHGDRDLFLSLQDRDDAHWYFHQADRLPSWYGSAELEPGQETSLAVLDAALLPHENRAWAVVAWAQQDGVYRRVQFYRQVEGQWLRTSVHRDYFGKKRIHQTAHFTFQYLARDERTVGWIAAQLEVWYDAVCADLNCSGGQRINVSISPNGETSREHRLPRGFAVRSPQLFGVRQDGAPLPDERDFLAQVLIYLLAIRQASDVEIGQQPFLLPQFVNWQMRRLSLAGENTPTTPVLDAVMTSRGIEGVRALLTSMTYTASEDEALRSALGVRLEDLNLVFGQYLAALLAVERQMMAWQTAERLVDQTAMPLAQQTLNALLPQGIGQGRSRMEKVFRGWPERGDAYFYPATPFSHPVVERWELLDDLTLRAEVSYWQAREYPRSKDAEKRIELFRRVDSAWRHLPPDERFLGRVERPSHPTMMVD